MNRLALAAAAAVPALLLAACSQPAEPVGEATAVTGDAANDMSVGAAGASNEMSAAADGVMAPGGVVSPPAANAAVDTGADADTTTAAASSSFTEGQAKGHIENAGYTNVTGLTKTADGLWIGKAMKDGQTMDVALDFKGAVTAR